MAPDRTPGLVSVVIPAFNAEISLSRAIESVLTQTYAAREVIVVNDGATDGTEAAATRYGDRIRYVAQDNRGETAARNTGFSLCRGEFISFLDHDDYWEPRFLETTVSFLQRHPEAAAVSVAQRCRNALHTGESICPALAAETQGADLEGHVIEHFLDFWADHNHICPGAALLRGSLYDQAGGQREDLVLSGDMEYWAYLSTFGKWGFIPNVLLNSDGTQVARGQLYRKYYDRYSRCTTVASWESRVATRITPGEAEGYRRIRGKVATGYVFAHIFVGRDGVAKSLASRYAPYLEGRFGRLWRLGLRLGWFTWKPMCACVRLRARFQYSRA